MDEIIPPRDPEFQATTTPERLRLYDPDAEAYQRLVANPFLALFGLLAGLALGRLVLQQRLPDFAAPVLLLLGGGWIFLLFRLLQYHCLDCGETGRIGRWRQHACESVRGRRREGKPRRFRGPPPPVQDIHWLWLTRPLAAIGLALVSSSGPLP